MVHGSIILRALLPFFRRVRLESCLAGCVLCNGRRYPELEPFCSLFFNSFHELKAFGCYLINDCFVARPRTKSKESGVLSHENVNNLISLKCMIN